MPLFLLIFYVIYCFSDCGKIDAANFNESILVAKHYQNLLQVDTVLKDVQQNMSVLKEEYVKHGKRRDMVDYNNIRDSRKIKQPRNGKKDHKERNAESHNIKSAKYQPRAQYNPLPTISDHRQDLTRWFPRFSSDLNDPQPPLVLRQPSSGYRMAIVPFNPGHGQGPPGFLLRPMRPRLNPPRLLSNYRYQNVYLRPPGPYMPSPLFAPRPKLEAYNQFPFDTEVNSFIQEYSQLFNPNRPTLSLPDFNTAESGTSQLVTLSSSLRPMTDKGANIWLQGPFGLYVPVIAKKDQSPSLSSKRKLVNSTTHRSATSPTSTTNRMHKVNGLQDVTGASVATQFFMQDKNELPYLNLLEKGGTPAPIPHDSNIWDSTTAGDVFYGKTEVRDPPSLSPTQRYRALMERLGEGYMLVFMIELCRLIAVKGRKEVRQALHYTETIYNQLWNGGRLDWIDEPLQTVIEKLAVTVSGDIDVVRTYASMMFHMLLRRRQVLSAEVNSILDDADLIYNDAEGGQLFAALEEFDNYPNTTKSSYWLCDSLIEGFLHPFPRHYRSGRRQKLLNAINAALKTRFPLLPKHHSGERHKPKKKRKRKHRHRYPYDVLRKRKRHSTPEYHNDNIYGRQDNANLDYENYILRSMTPMTSVPFRANPSNRYRVKTRPRTTVNSWHEPTRAYSFNKRNKKLSYRLRVTTPFPVKLDVLERNNEKRTRTTGHHHSGGMTSTAGRRPPPRDVSSNGSMLLASRSPGRWTRARKDVYEIKESIKNSEEKKIDGRGKLRAGLLRKISRFPNMLRSAHSVTGRS